MTALLVSHRFRRVYGEAFLADAKARGIDLELLVLPDDPEARLADELAVRAEVAYFSSDVFPQFGKPFFPPRARRPASNGCTSSTPASIIPCSPAFSNAACA